MLIKHIVFDFDGTLVDSTEVIVKVYNELADQYQFKKLRKEEYRAIMSLPLKERMKALHVPASKILLLRKIFREFQMKYRFYLKSVRILEGVFDVAYQLKEKGYKLSIITSNSASNIREYFNHREIDLFPHIQSSQGLFGKHRAIKNYMRQYQLTNKDLIYIGDEVRDIQASKKNRIDVIAVAWGLDPREALLSEEPSYYVEHPTQILEIVCGSRMA